MAPITFAHRGGMADEVENTLPAFRRALKHGATGLESDVRLSVDGIPVLAHDPTVRLGLRRVKVASTTCDRLASTGVPTLTDLYDDVGTDYELSLDVANLDSARAAVAVARGFGAAERLWVCTPDTAVLHALRDERSGAKLVHSTRSRAVEQHERHAADLSNDGIDAVNFHQSDWSLGLVTLYHRFGVLAFGWDAQETRHIRALMKMTIDAVYSDHVERMVATVAEWTAPES
jgi:glycerophosphoryl diester phosphodiesterase